MEPSRSHRAFGFAIDGIPSDTDYGWRKGKRMLSAFLIVYLFLGGAACAVFLVAIVFDGAVGGAAEPPSIAGRRKSRMRSRSFAHCCILALAMLVFALLCLVFDMPSPELALLVFTRPHTTVITFGSVVMALEFAVGILLTFEALFGIRLLKGPLGAFLKAACCILSLAAMVYPGIFLALQPAIPFWNTWTLVALFFTSSLSSGISAVLIVQRLDALRQVAPRPCRHLGEAHMICLVTEAAFLAAFAMHGALAPEAAPSMAVLLTPNMLATALVGCVGFALAVPFTAEAISIRGHGPAPLIPNFLCLCGGLILRCVIAACGVH